jgi:hypothetical protein
VSAPNRRRLGCSPSRSEGQSPTATPRENKIKDWGPPPSPSPPPPKPLDPRQRYCCTAIIAGLHIPLSDSDGSVRQTTILKRNAFAVTSIGRGTAGGQSDRGTSTGRTSAPTNKRGGLRNRPFARLLALIASALGKGNARKSPPGNRDPSNSLLIETAALRGRCDQYAGAPRARTPGPPSVRVVARHTPCHTVVPVAVWVPSNTRFWLPTLRARRRQQRSPRTRMGLRSPKSTP